MEEILRWPELLRHLEATYEEVETFAGDRLRFTYKHDGKAVPIGAQVLRSQSGSPWLVLAIKLGPVDKLRTRSALVANTDLPIGGLAIIMGHAVIRQSLPLLGLRPADLAHTLEALAATALHLRHVAELEDVDIDMPYAYVFR